MALCDCPECEGCISDQAFQCPHCGFPLGRSSLGQLESLVSRLTDGWHVGVRIFLEGPQKPASDWEPELEGPWFGLPVESADENCEWMEVRADGGTPSEKAGDEEDEQGSTVDYELGDDFEDDWDDDADRHPGRGGQVYDSSGNPIGVDQETIDTVFEGDPDLYWNID